MEIKKKFKKFVKAKRLAHAELSKEKKEFKEQMRKVRNEAYKKQAIKEAAIQGTKAAKQKFTPKKKVQRKMTPDEKKARELFNKLAYVT